MKVTVIGTGYVGLVSAACLADLGHDILCLDIDVDKINLLKSGGVPIHEPGLDEVIKRNVVASRLKFTTDIEKSVAHGFVQMIAVGTPSDEDGSADLQYVLAAAKNIAIYSNEYKVIVNKSTVPVGTAEKVKNVFDTTLTSLNKTNTFSVVSNPEFLKEGAAINDFAKPDRIVVGADDEKAIQVMRELYAPFHKNHDCLMIMDIKSAELTKYAANAMLATRISFMNELANLSEKVGADIECVRKGIGSDRRIGYDFLYPGCGYGGSCFPKDVRALKSTAEEFGVDLRVVKAVDEANESQKMVLLQKIVNRFGSNLKGKHFAIWGLSFKPGTDDVREATSRVVIEGLWNLGATVASYDPVAMNEIVRIYGVNHPSLRLASSAFDALNQADALVIITEWSEFKNPDFQLIKSTLLNPIIFDGRNILNPNSVRNEGFEYFGIGRF
jgi:UDPglucose 6-dehydrogenase